jgi:autoinducer 2-degrading protein
MTKQTDNPVVAMFFRVEARAGKRHELLEFLSWDSGVARHQEPRTIRFDVLPDPHCADAFYVFEAYEDQAALEKHKKNLPFQRWELPEFKSKVIADDGFTLIFEGTPLDVARRAAPSIPVDSPRP